jgi:hypothetical protein
MELPMAETQAEATASIRKEDSIPDSEALRCKELTV